MSSTAIQQYEDIGSQLTQWREPEQVMAEAQKAALCLKKVLDMKPNKVMFNGEQYLEREDWGTVAKFYGCTAKVTETKYVEYGNARGFEAVAVCLDRNLNEIARAESMCLSEEENWGEVPVYEWEDVLDANGKKIWIEGKDGKKGHFKANKVQRGTRSKPLFQLRSMAQTRAEAKVLKGVFGWVVVLAGYKPTPAEEMTGHEFDNLPERESKPPVAMPRSTDEKKEAPKAVNAKTVEQNPPAQQQSEKPEQISGVITDAREGKGKQEGALFVIVNGKIVCIPSQMVNKDMVKGAKVLIRAFKKANKNGDTYMADDVEMVVPPVAEGEIIEGEVKEAPLTDEMREVADELFGGEKPKAQEATEVPAPDTGRKPTKTGTAGEARATRLKMLIRQNEKNTGFTFERFDKYKKMLGVEHAADLPCPKKETGAFNAYEHACAMAVGDIDWHEVFED